MTTGTIITGIVLIVMMPAFAQPGDPTQEEPEVPMEGIEILVVTGAVLGISKLISSNKTLLNTRRRARAKPGRSSLAHNNN